MFWSVISPTNDHPVQLPGLEDVFGLSLLTEHTFHLLRDLVSRHLHSGGVPGDPLPASVRHFMLSFSENISLDGDIH